MFRGFLGQLSKQADLARMRGTRLAIFFCIYIFIASALWYSQVITNGFTVFPIQLCPPEMPMYRVVTPLNHHALIQSFCATSCRQTPSSFRDTILPRPSPRALWVSVYFACLQSSRLFRSSMAFMPTVGHNLTVKISFHHPCPRDSTTTITAHRVPQPGHIAAPP